MQGKVSMVVTCYNKEKQILAMLESVRAQRWDNLQVILVNDGSTDGTRNIIAEWMPKLEARGYEVVVIDQANTGVRGAFKAGLDAVDGEYFCSIDADDRIEPDYVQALAGFLEENPEFEWCSCDFRIWNAETDEVMVSGAAVNDPCAPGETPFLENYLLGRTCGFTWIYMVRTAYLRACNVAENFGIERNAIHEQDLALPLIGGGGKHRHIDRPLYNYYLVAGSLSLPGDYEKKCLYFEDWARCCIASLYKLGLGDVRTRTLEKLVEAGKLIRQWQAGGEFADATGAASKASVCVEALRRLLEAWAGTPFVPPLPSVPPNFESAFVCAVQDVLVGAAPAYAGQRAGRVVAWGALGRAGKRRLATLVELDIRPDILWDTSARDERLYGRTVEKPQPETLTPEDILLVLPSSGNAVASIRSQIEAAGHRPFLVDTPLAYRQFTGCRLFPQLYTASYRL